MPYSQFIPWIVRNGLDLTLLFEAITSTRIGAFANIYGCRLQVRYW
nr:DUF2834 domain-containing protein [Cohnella sp. LGH]